MASVIPSGTSVGFQSHASSEISLLGLFSVQVHGYAAKSDEVITRLNFFCLCLSVIYPGCERVAFGFVVASKISS